MYAGARAYLPSFSQPCMVLPQTSSCFLGSKQSSRHRGYLNNWYLDPFSCSFSSNSLPVFTPRALLASPPWMPPLLPYRSSGRYLSPTLFSVQSLSSQVKTVPELNQNTKPTNNFRVILQYHHWP